MTFGIQPMSSSDVAAVATLNAELGYSGSVDGMRSRFAAITGRPAEGLFVAVRDGAVIGWIHVQAQHSLVSDPFAEVTGLVVAKDARRNGLGRALVERAKGWAVEQGYSRLRVRSNVIRDEAHKFYPAMGFRLVKTSHNYDIAL
jgi:GNAT superfamily N-acetyltransferase